MAYRISIRPVTALVLTLLLLVCGVAIYSKIGRPKAPIPLSEGTLGTADARLLLEGQQLHLQIKALRLDRKFSEAIPLAQRALRLREEVPGKRSLEYAQALKDLGFLYRFTDEYDKAEELLTDALALERDLLGRDGLESAETLNYLGAVHEAKAVYEAKEDFAHAEQEVSLALSIGEKYGGRLDPNVATSLARLGSIYRHQHSYSQSEAALTRALAIDESHAVGDKSPEVTRDLYFLAQVYKDTRDFPKALDLANKAEQLDESLHPPYNLQLSVDLGLIAQVHEAADELPGAEAAYKQVIDIDKRWFGPRDLTIASDYQDLANVYELEDKYAEAEPLRKDILVLDHENDEDLVATTSDMNDLADLYKYMGRYQEAIAVDQRAMALDLTLSGKDKDLAISVDLSDLGQLYQRVGSYKDADDYFSKAVSLDRLRAANKSGRQSDIAWDLRVLLKSYYDQGRAADATPLLNEVRRLDEQNSDPTYEGLAEDLILAAQFAMLNGKYDSAKPLLQRALDFYEIKYRQDTIHEVEALENLAFAFGQSGDWGRAHDLLTRAVTICRENPASRPRTLAYALLWLGKSDTALSRLHDAEVNLNEAVKIAERTVGAKHDFFANVLIQLAFVYYYQGRYPDARSAYETAISVFESSQGKSLQLANALQNYSFLLIFFGDLNAAERADIHALQLYSALSHRDLNKLPVLNTLAAISNSKGDVARAEQLYRAALRIGERQTGANRAYARFPLAGLAFTSQVRGDYEPAEQYVRRALRLEQRYVGPEGVNYAYYLNQLAYLQLLQGKYKAAESNFTATLALRRRILGDNHPSVASTLSNLGLTYLREGRRADAIAYQVQSSEIVERNARLLLTVGSEQQKLMYARYLARNTDYVLSSYGLLGDPAATQLAMSVVLSHKGRVLDFVSDSLQAARDRASDEDRHILDELFTARTRLVGLVFGKGTADLSLGTVIPTQFIATNAHNEVLPRGQRTRNSPLPNANGFSEITDNQYREAVNQLETEIDGLERLLNAHTASLAARFSPVTYQSIQNTVPDGYTLIEIVRLHISDMRATWIPGPARYFGFVFSHAGPPKCEDLGPAEKIDRLVYPLRKALQDPNSTDVEQRSRTLSKLVTWPLLKHAGANSKILVSPDGPLNLIPFEALVSENGHYLVEKYEFTYLSSGRDLLRFGENVKPREGPVIIANPEFNVSVSGSGTPEIHPLPFGSLHFSKFRFSTLSGTEDEADGICDTVVCAEEFTGPSATKSKLFSVKGPVVLHIATHGFFRGSGDSTVGAGDYSDKQSKFDDWVWHDGNPLLRSGLALTGANASDVTHANGIATALEISGLDLKGTELVVLSACETGLGDLRDGEGVYGLRRALVVAGTRSQLTTLWKVDDDASRSLMIAYYKALAAGGGRSQVLRDIKLTALKDQLHPYYWASFIPSGYWGQVDGLKPNATVSIAAK
jgi:CHAT domain-containing protein/tetratricopeptide (TPR) repeat protein